MADPLVPLGSLNRLRASVVWNDFPQLNITSSYLGTEGIRLGLDGLAVTFLPAMTGTVASPEPFQMITLAANLLKTQRLADLYKSQMEIDARIGNGTVYPDVAVGQNGLGVYQINNCAIESVAELNFAGTDAGFRVTMRGYYLINAALWGSG
jgi:hypothetical protein